MTNGEQVELVREKIRHYIVLYRAKEYNEEQVTGQILSIKELKILAPDQEPPDMAFPTKFSVIPSDLLLATRDHILKYLKADNWVKVV